ncbi:prolyl oligopeptidase family serine peptidase [bacterium]|nr:prolyl oligopeptidase family serine peptidase [bacterium]
MQTPDSELESHLYLEEVLGEAALEKVKSWNAQTLQRLEADPLFEQMNAEALDIVNSKDKIPYVSYRHGVVHNFWQDADRVRGVWRTTTLESYLSDTPDWETVLDIDALSEAEDKNWVYKGAMALRPREDLYLVCLSDGGKDAAIYREFDIRNKSFVEDGFVTTESKGGLSWLDQDNVLVGIDFGEDANGNSTMSDSGYPMIAKLWCRGTSIEDAVELGRGIKTDVSFSAITLELADDLREIFLVRAVSFYDRIYHWLPMSTGKAQEKIQLPVPSKCAIGGVYKDQMLVGLNEDWQGFASGDLVSFSCSGFMANGRIGDVHLLYSPAERASINNYGVTKSAVLVSIIENVIGSVRAFDWDGAAWVSVQLDFPEGGSVSIGATDRKEDIAFVSTESFLTPVTLWKYETDNGSKEAIKSLPEWFDSRSMIAEQFETPSSDGTLIPYFVVRQRDLSLDSRNPTLLYGYGGFQVSLDPAYSAVRGKLWIERGGVYVQANIRGGGEFGPAWHQAGLKTRRQIIYDDFIAIAQDLINKKITSPSHLGIEGGSNGGLLVGVMFTQRPDLFSAVVCAVPLLDMMRYHLLLAGASWVGEYGNPEDKLEGSFLRSISPYHNVQANEKYPEVFFLTSTKDDRVHPAHARKMAARFEDLGYKFLYYENIDGGHSAAANLKETARRVALQHVYLMEKLG